jgi:anti-sigma B factor antagonist
MHPDDPHSTAQDRALTVLLAPDTEVTVVGLCGELDMATEPELLATVDRLRSAGTGSVVLDVTRLTFCDARGLAALADLHDQLAAVGMQLAVVGASPQLRRLLAITGLDAQLDLRSGPGRRRRNWRGVNQSLGG